MGNQLAASGSAAAVNLSDISDNAKHLQLVAPLGGAKRGRLFTSLHCRQLASSSDVVIKVFVQRAEDKAQATAINSHQDALYMIELQMRRYFKDNPEAPCNLLLYTIRSRHGGYCLLQRPYVHYSLAERIQMRPFWQPVQRLFACYQLLQALVQLHEGCKCTHGDLKPENVLLSSQDWLYITDFCPFKPPSLPIDNPANFEFFYDNSETRYCCCGPEKFADKTQQGSSPLPLTSPTSVAFPSLSSSAAAATSPSTTNPVTAIARKASFKSLGGEHHRSHHQHTHGGAVPEEAAEQPYPPYHTSVANSLHYNNTPTSVSTFGTVLGMAGAGAGGGGAPAGSISNGTNTRASVASVGGGVSNFFGNNGGKEEQLSYHLASADVFAAACVIIFILTDEPIFKLSSALEFNGKSPSERRAFLLRELTHRRVTNEPIRELLCAMMCCEPSQRPSASHILRQFSPCVFPHSFAFLHANVIPTVQQMPPDAQIHFMFNRHSDLLQTADVCDSDRHHKGEEKESGEDRTTARERFIEVMGMNSEEFNQTLDREDRTEDARESSTANSSEHCAPNASTNVRHLEVPLSPPNAAARERLTTVLLPYLASALRFSRSSDARSRGLIIMRRWLEWSSEVSRRDIVLPWARQVLQSRRAGLQPRVNAVRTLREALLSLPTLTTSEAFLFEDYVLEVFESLMREPGVLAPQVTNSIVGTAATSSMEGVVLLQPMLSLLTEIAASLPAMLLVGCSYVRQRQRIYAQIAQSAADRKNRRRGQRNEQGRQEESLSSDDDDDDGNNVRGEGDFGQNGGTRSTGGGEKFNTPTTATSAATEDYSSYAYGTPSFDSELREVVDRGWELLKVLLSANQSAVAIAALEQTPALCRVLGQERVVSELLPILTTFLSTTAAEVKTAFLQQVPFLAAFLQGSVGAGGGGSTSIGIGSGPSAVASFLSMVLEDGLRQPDVACVCAALESVRVIATTMSIPSESIMPTVSIALRHVHSPNAWIQDRACSMVEEIARKYSPSELLLHVVRPMLGRLKRAVPLVSIRSHTDALKAFWEVGEGGSNPPGPQASDPFLNSYALSSPFGTATTIATNNNNNANTNTNNIHILICSDPLPPCVDYLAAVYDPSRIIATGSREVAVRASEESPLASSHADIYTPDLAAAKTHTTSSKRGGATARSNTMSSVGQNGTTSVNLHTTANMGAYNNKSFAGAAGMSGAMGMSAATTASFTAAMGSPTLSSPSSTTSGGGGGGVGGLVSVGVTAAALVQRLVHTYESFTVSTTAAGCMRRGDYAAHNNNNAYSSSPGGGDPRKEDILIVVSDCGEARGEVISNLAGLSSSTTTALMNSIVSTAASSRVSCSIRAIRPWRMSVFKPTTRQLKRIDARDQLYLPNPPNRQSNSAAFEIIGNNNTTVTTTTTIHNGGVCDGTFSSPNTVAMSSTASPPSLTSVGGTGGVRARSSIFGGTSASAAGGGASESDAGSPSNANHHRNLFSQWDQQNPNNANNAHLSSLNADEALHVHVGGPSPHPLTARESRGVNVRAAPEGFGGTRASLASTYSPSSATAGGGGGGGSDRSLTRGSIATAAAYGGGNSSGSMSASASASSVHHPSTAAAGTLRPIASALATHNGPAWDPLAAPITCMSTGGSLIMTGGARGLVSLWDAEYMVRSRRCSPHHFKGVVPASETVLFAQFTYNMNSPAVIGSTDSTLRLFDPQTEALYATHTYASSTEGALRACVRLTPNVTLVGSDGGSLFAVDWRSRSSSVWSTRVALPEGGVTALVSLHHQLQHQQHQQATGGGLGGGIGAAVGDPMLGDAYGFVAGTSEGYVSLFDLRFRLSVKSFSATVDSSPRARKGLHPAAHSHSPGAWRSVLSLCLDPRTTNRVDTSASLSPSSMGNSAPSVMVSTADGALRRFALETGEPTLRLQPFCSSVGGSSNGYGCASRAMLHIPRTPMMITGSDDGLIRLWDFSTPRLSRTVACPPQRSGRYDYIVPNSNSSSNPKNFTDPNPMLHTHWDDSNVPVILERDPTTAWQSSGTSSGGASSSAATSHGTANYGGSHPYGIATFTYHNTTTSAANISVGIGACATARYGGGGGVAVSGAGATVGGMGARVGSNGGGGGGLKASSSSSSSSFPPYAFDPLAPLHSDHITALAVVTVRGSQQYLVSAARDGSLKLWGNQPSSSSSARGGKGGAKAEDDNAY